MYQYSVFELTFTDSSLREMNPCLPLTAVFTCGGERTVVKGFYDGDSTCKIRFLPMKAGLYTWEVTGLFTASGSEECLPAKDGDHGPVRAEETHFIHADGTPFVPFGTTVYALAHQDDELVALTLESLRTAPFNKLRMCVFPKDYNYNRNEPPFYPFEKKADGTWDVSRPCIAFWHRFEKILGGIFAMGIQVDLILFHPYDRWGFASLPQPDNLLYLDYLIRRLAAFPGIWWSLANEYDLCLDRKSLADWEEIEAFVAENDPHAHLLSCHNCFRFWDAARPAVTHASIQTKGLSQIPCWIDRYKKPVIIDECCYEGDLPEFWGSISGREMVNRFWRAYASGAFCTHGETFLADDEVIWWAKGGQLKGESPARIAFLRGIIESLPGPLSPRGNRLLQIAQLDEAGILAAAERLPEEVKSFALTIGRSIASMDAADRTVHLAGEHEWASHAGEDAYLWFNDLQCFGLQTLPLPDAHTYRVEYIDTWNMTRTLVTETASGPTQIRLPGREGLAVLAVRTDM